jgi:hypothetical protein
MEEGAPLIGTPEEELRYLRELVAKKEQELLVHGENKDRLEIVEEHVVHHHREGGDTVLDPAYKLSEEEGNKIALNLSPDNNDATMRELRLVLESKGVRNALSVAERLKSPHLFDDFHRFLVQYIASGIEALGLPADSREWKALHMTLYQVVLPEGKQEKGTRPLRELLSSMEQFYAGMLSIAAGSGGKMSKYFSIELGIPAGSKEVSFYVSVPNERRDLFEKQLLAIFPDAIPTIESDDYNPFIENGKTVASYASFKEHPSLTLRTYESFDYDPLNSLLNAFSKIEQASGGAALQVLIEPVGDSYISHYKKILRELEKGESKDRAFSVPKGEIGLAARDFLDEITKREKKEGSTDQALIEHVSKKIETPIVRTNIRILVSASDEMTAERSLHELEASFNQFQATRGNMLIWNRVKGGRKESLLKSFSFRYLEGGEDLPLSLREATTVMHFPPEGISSTPQLKQARFTGLPAPLELPQTGTLLGANTYRGVTTKAYLTDQDRMRHLYVIGQTGTGKTKFLQNLIVQDMRQGHGLCFIDPHGNDIIEILALVPRERVDDVIYVDPAYLDRVVALNLLEYDEAHPEQKTFIVNELFAIFQRLYGAVPESIGPAFEQYFRNATQLVMDDPSTGNTLLDVRRIFTDPDFREMKVAGCRNQLVKSFWEGIATKARGDQGLENYGPYITNKFDDFVTNEFVRPIIGQEKSSFNFREIMDNKKILLVNLSKGRLGERNANFLGLLFVGKLFMAALSRADSVGTDFPPFFLHIDEFQNITTDTIPGILSEARKYKLSLSIAHQYLKQVDEKTLNAIFGNVGSMGVFRVGPEDAEQFEKQFSPHLKAVDFMNIENFNCYTRLLANNIPQRPFNVRVPPPEKGNPDQVDDLRQLSYLTYGRDRTAIEEHIQSTYLKQ